MNFKNHFLQATQFSPKRDRSHCFLPASKSLAVWRGSPGNVFAINLPSVDGSSKNIPGPASQLLPDPGLQELAKYPALHT